MLCILWEVNAYQSLAHTNWTTVLNKPKEEQIHLYCKIWERRREKSLKRKTWTQTNNQQQLTINRHQLAGSCSNRTTMVAFNVTVLFYWQSTMNDTQTINLLMQRLHTFIDSNCSNLADFYHRDFSIAWQLNQVGICFLKTKALMAFLCRIKNQGFDGIFY